MENLTKILGDTHQHIRTAKTGILNLQQLIQKVKKSVPLKQNQKDKQILKILSQEDSQLKEEASKQKLLSFLDQLTDIEQHLNQISGPITKLENTGGKLFKSTSKNNTKETADTILLGEQKQLEIQKLGGSISINKNGILVVHQSDRSRREKGDLYFQIGNIIGPTSTDFNIHKRSGGAYGNSSVIFVEEKKAA